ncbi:hypothetical protein P168DRAFT_305277 [Aspergillus campestris IBT 28561]|uniref:Uncharacterized protein n=1 Tax=Aspergillus campestris (strain IBT 28561) TaxID=1392248 RepID=A0A2I1CZ30_ASPC2|nr:uncharacterized protein P168DRAFT_305277 [Aspergillus campestris IBT 28561]PKY02893.1 hypothetical protein P168DRAFT_305277 [Aspergillus campestris IBT 28561]
MTDYRHPDPRSKHAHHFRKLKNTSYPRIMASGRCQFETEQNGSCDCSRGLYILAAENRLSDDCLNCHHPLSKHADGETDKIMPRPLKSRKVTDDLSICPREGTVQQLADLILSRKVVHVRGTPASGKTTLAQLLKDHLSGQGRNVYFMGTWRDLDTLYESPPDPWDKLETMLRSKFPCPVDKDILSQAVLIIDEGQTSYNDSILWNEILKPRCYGKGEEIMFCLFCSYGSPSTGVETTTCEFTPAILNPAQRVTLTPQTNAAAPDFGLFFSKTEFYDATSRIGSKKEPPIKLQTDAIEYLFSFTNGHPGALESMMEYFFHIYRSNVKHRQINAITKSHLIDGLKSEDNVFRHLAYTPVYRSFPQGVELTRECADVLLTILENGDLPWNSNSATLQCYTKGWIHKVATGNLRVPEIYVLPSRLHEKWVEFLIGFDPQPLPERFDTVYGLCLDVLRRFSTIALRCSSEGRKLSTGATYRPIESQYQDEFYRVFTELVGRRVPMSSEWSRNRDGRVDFLIQEKKWAIELLREHSKINEHITRFRQGGNYYSWIQEGMICDWIIINCATTLPTQVSTETKLVHAIFQNDFTELHLYDNLLGLVGTWFLVN